MKTFWTVPDGGATLNQLLMIVKSEEVPYKFSEKRLQELIEKYGGESKGGLGIKTESYNHFEELDEARILSESFEAHVASNRTKGGTIDLTPSWEEAARVILMVLENGNEEGKRIAKQELFKMAKLADEYVKTTKEKGDN